MILNLRGTPLRGTPLRGTPLRGTPMKHLCTHLSLTSLDDRIVPSVALTNPGQSGVVNSIYIEGTAVGGVDISNPSLNNSDSSSAVDFVSDVKKEPTPLQLAKELEATFGRVNDTRTKLEKIPPTPTPQNVDATGNLVPARLRGINENAQVERLIGLIGKNIDEISAIETKILEAEIRREFLYNDAVNNKIFLKQNAVDINALKDKLYKLQRKNIEMQNAIQCIKQNADHGYPEDSLLAPQDVFDQALIGTNKGTFVSIDEVLKEK